MGISGEIRFPYRGLSAFRERDAALFFSREAAASAMLELMSWCLEGLIGTMMQMVHELPVTTSTGTADCGSYDSDASDATACRLQQPVKQ